jgi:hypothetical protein
MSRITSASALLLYMVAASLGGPGVARAQGGPPYLTNDPGTPGNANWEINIASLQAIGRDLGGYTGDRANFVGYFGIQILLSDYGRALGSEP